MINYTVEGSGNMNLSVSKEAAAWYIEEMGLNKGDSVKFFGKVYGKNGFSIALTVMEPSRPLTLVEVSGINFYVEKSDSWFFEEVNLDITMDETIKEPKYDIGK